MAMVRSVFFLLCFSARAWGNAPPVKLFNFDCSGPETLLCAGATGNDVCTVDECAARAQAQGAAFFSLRRDGDAQYTGRCFAKEACDKTTNNAFSEVSFP